MCIRERWFMPVTSYFDCLNDEKLLCANMNFYAFELKSLLHRSMDANHLEATKKRTKNQSKPKFIEKYSSKLGGNEISDWFFLEFFWNVFIPVKSMVDVFASYPSPLSDSCTSFNANVIPRLIALPKQCK